MTFGDDGTLYVLEWLPETGGSFPEQPETFTYKDGSTRKVATMKKHVKDVVKVLRLSTGKELPAPARFKDWVCSVAFSRDGKLLVSAGGSYGPRTLRDRDKSFLRALARPPKAADGTIEDCLLLRRQRLVERLKGRLRRL